MQLGRVPPASLERTQRRDGSPVGIAVAGQGTIVVISGTTSTGVSGFDIFTVALDAASGESLWSASFDGAAHQNDEAAGIAANADGTLVFVTGTSVQEETDSDYVTVAYDALTGEELWTRLLDGGARELDEAAAIGVAPG